MPFKRRKSFAKRDAPLEGNILIYLFLLLLDCPREVVDMDEKTLIAEIKQSLNHIVSYKQDVDQYIQEVYHKF